MLVEHVRLLVAEGAPFVYAYYPGVDEVAHAYGLARRRTTRRSSPPPTGSSATLLDALPADAALLVTADHGQVQVGPDGWLGLDPLDPMVETYAGDGRFRYLHARPGAAADAVRGGAGSSTAADAWVFRREQLLDEGWLGPDPVPATYRRGRRRRARGARPASAFVDPTLPYEAQLRLRPRLAHPGRDAGAAASPRAAEQHPDPRALTSANYTRVIHPQALWTGLWTSGAGPPGATLAKSFVHLHLHTEFSMLDGAARIPDVVATAAADGQPAVGITDHGNMYGVLDFYRAAREADLTPVIGTEAYMVTTSRSRPAAARPSTTSTTSRCSPRSTQGYRNLIKVSSHAYLDGFFQKPRVDFELLEQHHEGLVGTTGCLGGAVSQALLAGRLPRSPGSTSTASSRSSGATRSSSSCRTTACPSSCR